MVNRQASKLGVGYYLKKMAKAKNQAEFLGWSYALNLYLIGRAEFEVQENKKFFDKINKKIFNLEEE